MSVHVQANRGGVFYVIGYELMDMGTQTWLALG